MSISREEVWRVAELARLEIADDAVDRVAAQMSSILDFVATLNTLDLTDRAPTTFAPADALLREDVPDEARRLGAERATAAAPASEDGYFLVPPIVENVNP